MGGLRLPARTHSAAGITPHPAMAPGPHCWPAGTAAPGAATALGRREVEVKVTGRVLKAGEAFSVSPGDT